MRIPIVDISQDYKFLKKDIDKQLEDCLGTQNWVLGEKVNEFEDQVAKYLGVKYAVGVASGTDALILSLEALALKAKKRPFFDKKDEIITTPFTFIATAESIVRCGATPVFVDIDPGTFNIDPEKIKKAITKNTVGIVPVHLYGLPCYMDEISDIAKKYALFIVEDCAQSFGANFNGRKTGTFGDCGAFSFFPSKNLGGFGDGGLITTKDSKLNEIIKALRNHGQSKLYNASFIGYNSRLDSIQAAVLSAKLKYVDKLNEKRRTVASRYNEHLSRIKEIEVPLEPKKMYHVYNLYTIKVPSKRDELLNYLNSCGIGSRVYYPVLLNKMAAFKYGKLNSEPEKAKRASSSVLSLPVHPFLTDREVNYVISMIKGFYR